MSCNTNLNRILILFLDNVVSQRQWEVFQPYRSVQVDCSFDLSSCRYRFVHASKKNKLYYPGRSANGPKMSILGLLATALCAAAFMWSRMISELEIVPPCVQVDGCSRKIGLHLYLKYS